MLEAGVPVGAGTDATRVASYNPWVALEWLVTGRTVGGLTLYKESNRLDRLEALRLWTDTNTWFSSESGKKGRISASQLADLAVLSDDYFSLPEECISDITSVLTIVGGKVVHASDEFANLAPPLPPAMPDWSPVRYFGGNQVPAADEGLRATACVVHGHAHSPSNSPLLWGGLGCSCWAF